MDHEEDPVDVVLAQYLAERETNPATPIDAFASRLPADRLSEFHNLLDTVALADRQLPGGKPPRPVLGGRYRLESRLGDGGFGDVWKSHDATLGRPVAVKILSRSSADGWAGDAVREARILGNLDHPGIVRILDAGQDDGSSFLVMELVPGRTLHQVLCSLRALGRRPTAADLANELGGLPNAVNLDLHARGSYHRAIAFLFADAARGLQAAHARSVLHRDIKPANLLLRPGGQPTWIDFGLAGHLHSSGGQSVKGVVGTPQYLAPEQIRSDRMGKDPRLDVYQLGVMLYEALTLQPAFEERENRDQIYARILSGRFRWPRRLDADLPRTLEDICLKAMYPRPEGRYQDMQQLVTDLDRASVGELPVASHGRVGPLSPLRAWLMLRRHRVAVSVASALAAVLLLGVWLGHSRLQVVRLNKLSESSFVFAMEKSATRVMPVRLAVAGSQPPASGNLGIRLDPGEHEVVFERVLRDGNEVVLVTLPAGSDQVKGIEWALKELLSETSRDPEPGFDIAMARKTLESSGTKGAIAMPKVADALLGQGDLPGARVQRTRW